MKQVARRRSIVVALAMTVTVGSALVARGQQPQPTFTAGTKTVAVYTTVTDARGRLGNRRVFATYVGRTPPLGASSGVASGADDLVIDNEGRVYSITAAGIEVLTAAGQPLGIIPAFCTPAGARCQSLAFGGTDKRTLFVAGAGTLLKYQMVAQGFTGRAK